jgi:general secretion pathway protein L
MLSAEAREAPAIIVPQDLLRRTPVKAEDIFSDYVAGTATNGRILVRQWVTRRRYVQEVADALGVPLAHIGFVLFGNADPAPMIRLLPAQAGR